jgi:hypothetical protein
MEIIEYKNTMGEDCVSVINDDGSMWSGYKFAHEEMIKAQDETTVI